MRTFSFVLLALLGAAGCKAPAPAPPPAAVPPPTSPAPASSAPPAAAAGPIAELERMDPRTPVPLLPMMANHQKQQMRGHLEAVDAVIAALAAHDFAAVEKAAGELGLSPGTEQMCEHMGMGAPGFTEKALDFHRSADAIVKAAQAKDEPGVLTALDATIKRCTGCHATYRQQVVDEAGWQAATQAPPPMHGP